MKLGRARVSTGIAAIAAPDGAGALGYMRCNIDGAGRRRDR